MWENLRYFLVQEENEILSAGSGLNGYKTLKH